MLADSTGLNLCGAGEWPVEKHGTRTRRSWRKLHIGVDAGTAQIVATDVTINDIDDGSQVGPLLDQVTGPVASFTGDGAYERDDVYDAVAERHPDAAVIVPPRSTAVPSDTANTAPTQRDRHLWQIADCGRMGWQKTRGYNRRALVEAAIGRYKRVIGDTLRSLTLRRQVSEVAVVCKRPEPDAGVRTPKVRSYRLKPDNSWGQCVHPADSFNRVAWRFKLRPHRPTTPPKST